MKVYACYVESGLIVNIMRCIVVGDSYENDTGLKALEVNEEVGITTHYISNGNSFEKAPLSLTVNSTSLIANGTDEAVISNIPAGAQVEWPDGQIDIVTDGEIRFSVDLPGAYTFRFTAVPYLDKEITVEAIAAT